VLGVVQGLTEFAPVSSSGHLILVPWLFNWTFFLDNPDLNKSFDVALHIGTLVGAIAYFRTDVATYSAAWIRSARRRRVETPDERIAWLLIIGTIPSVATGFLLQDFIEEQLGQPWLIAVMLAVFGVVLYVVDRVAARWRGIEDLRTKDALMIGVAQALALQPGVSRSGVTITAARGLSMDRAAAARFSFLLSLPVIAGAVVFKVGPLLGEGLPPGMIGPFLWGILASAVSGYLVIRFLLAYLRRASFAPFVVYRLALATLVFGLISLGIREATIG
jgi:undecaprenyl-diphosphatase